MSLFAPVTSKGYHLFHEGMQALSQVEANGIRIDTEYLCRAKAECKAKKQIRLMERMNINVTGVY